MANRQNTLLLKRSNVIGKLPPLSGLTLGEMALNTADAKLYTLYTSGSVTPSEVRQIGWDRISRTGDTVTGDFNFFGDISISGSSLPDGYALAITGDTNLNGDVYAQGDLFYSGSVIITGSTIIEDGLTANTIYTDYIDFNNALSPLPPDLEGRIYWDEDNGSLSLGMHGGQVIQQIGLEHYYYIKNQSGATIENGRVVRAAGTLGSSGRILGEYMIADGTIPAKFTLGIATEDIIDGDDGYVTEFGLVRGIDATGSLYGEVWSGGTILWVSPTIPGGLTSVEPQAPDLKIEMAIVIDADANGSIFVRPNRYPYLYDLQQVNYSAGTENNLDILQWNESNLTWDKTNTPSFSGLTVYNNINHFGNYILEGNISQTGNTNQIGNFNLTGDTIIQSGITASTYNISSTPNENNTLNQILGRNETTGQVDYRQVNTIGNNYTYVSGATYSALTTDNVLGVDSSISATTIYLPDSITSGRLRYDIKDIGLNSFTNNITIISSGTDTIISTEISNSVILQADGGALIIFNTGTGTWLQM